MKARTFSVAIPPELLSELRAAAKERGMSVADAIHESIRQGLPRLRQRVSHIDWSVIAPLTVSESQEAFGRDPEWDGLEAAMARLPVPVREE